MDAPTLTARGPVGPEQGSHVTLRLFAAARQTAGTGRAAMVGSTVSEVLERAGDRFGPAWVEVATHSRIWVNGEPVGPDRALVDGDEVAVLPPVSGGAR